MLLNKQVPRNMIHRKYGVTIKPHNKQVPRNMIHRKYGVTIKPHNKKCHVTWFTVSTASQ